MVWGEVEGVFFAQQGVVSVACVLLDVISTIVVIVFNLCNDATTKTNKTNKQLEADESSTS